MKTEEIPVFGIDLGTSTTVVATYSSNSRRPTIVNNSNDGSLTDSVICVNNEGCLLVGKNAKNLQTNKNYVFASKRLLGKDEFWTDDGKCKWTDGKKEVKRYPDFKGAQLTPGTVASALVQFVTIQNWQVTDMVPNGQKPKVVVTYPAYFSDKAKGRTEQAVKLMDNLDVLGMIEEPIAAAYSYMYKKELKNKTVLIYDWGGGTFDVSIIRFNELGEGKVESVEGNQELGGIDCDLELMDVIWKKYIEKQKKVGLNVKFDFRKEDFDPNKTHEDLDAFAQIVALRDAAQTTKKGLTDSFSSIVPVFNVEITREEFETCIKDVLRRTFDIVHEALNCPKALDAMKNGEKKTLPAIDPKDIDEVFLVGGSSYMPCVKTQLEKEFGWQGKVSIDQPEFAVAKGAALYAHSLVSPNNDSCISSRALVNIAKATYGVRCLVDGKDDEYEIFNLIFKGQPLPATKEHTFCTAFPNQNSLKILVYKSDALEEVVSLDLDFVEEVSNPDPKSNVVHFESRVPRGTPVDVTFTLEASGLIEVEGKSKVDSGYCKFSLSLKGSMNRDAVLAARKQMSK